MLYACAHSKLHRPTTLTQVPFKVKFTWATKVQKRHQSSYQSIKRTHKNSSQISVFSFINSRSRLLFVMETGGLVKHAETNWRWEFAREQKAEQRPNTDFNTFLFKFSLLTEEMKRWHWHTTKDL